MISLLGARFFVSFSVSCQSRSGHPAPRRDKSPFSCSWLMQLTLILGIGVTHTVADVHGVEVFVLLIESTHIRDLAVLIPASDALRRAAGQENREAQQQNLHWPSL